jgi:hypothetical protein
LRCDARAQEADVTERVPQHDPPPDAELVQLEVDERDDSILVDGDDRDHVLPPTELDPFTPEPSPPSGNARTALWIALVIAVAVIVFVIVVALR